MKYAEFVQLAEADKEIVINKLDEVFHLVEGEATASAELVVSHLHELFAMFEEAPKGDTPDAPAKPAEAAPDTSGVQTSSDLRG